jgi:tyrosyl-tRNA synthetase
VSGASLVDLLVHAGLSASKGQARNDIQSGGIYINNKRCSDVGGAAVVADLLFDKHLLLRKGKRNYVVVTAASAA